MGPTNSPDGGQFSDRCAARRASFSVIGSPDSGATKDGPQAKRGMFGPVGVECEAPLVIVIVMCIGILRTGACGWLTGLFC